MNNRDKVKKDIANILKLYDKGCPKGYSAIPNNRCPTPNKRCDRCTADAILAIDNLEVKADDQTPPKIIIEKHSRDVGCPHCGEDFGIENNCETEQWLAQQDMIEAGWVKVEKEAE
jgi:hypothetical protein